MLYIGIAVFWLFWVKNGGAYCTWVRAVHGEKRYLDITIDLKVQEMGAFEYMVFIAKGAAGAEAAGALLPGGVGVTDQFNLQAVVGAAKPEGLSAEVVGACV